MEEEMKKGEKRRVREDEGGVRKREKIRKC